MKFKFEKLYFLYEIFLINGSILTAPKFWPSILENPFIIYYYKLCSFVQKMSNYYSIKNWFE